MIDFGLGKKYDPGGIRDSNAKQIGYFIATVMFASNSALQGLERYPKDDLESLFYVLLYLKNGSIPWLKGKSDDKNSYMRDILKIRQNLSIEDLFSGFSEEMIFIYKPIINLSYYEKPNYDIYIQIMDTYLRKIKLNKYLLEDKFDWEIKFEEINRGYKNLNPNMKDLKKLEFLKKGYSLEF